jgi:hypothetical protein
MGRWYGGALRGGLHPQRRKRKTPKGGCSEGETSPYKKYCRALCRLGGKSGVRRASADSVKRRVCEVFVDRMKWVMIELDYKSFLRGVAYVTCIQYS